MPPKRKYDSPATRRLTSWLRSSRARTGGRTNVSSVRRGRSTRRMARGRRGARRRISSYRKRSKGGSSFAKLTRILAPVSSYQFAVAGRAEVAVAPGTTNANCRWFLPQRAADFSLGYPNILDVTDLAYYLRQQGRNAALLTDVEMHSLDSRFITRDYRQLTKIVNQCNAQCIIEYHVIEARRDIPFRFNAEIGAYNLLDFLGNGFYATALQSASATGVEVSDPLVTSGINSINSAMSDASFSIFSSGPFLHYFKVKKVRKVIMNAGDIKMFELDHKAAITHRPATYARLIATDGSWQYQQNDPFYSFLKGSLFQLFKLTGTPVNDRDTKTNVNLSSPAVDFFTNVSMKYQAVVKTGAVNYRGPGFGLGSIPNPQFMGEQTDTALPVTNA